MKIPSKRTKSREIKELKSKVEEEEEKEMSGKNWRKNPQGKMVWELKSLESLKYFVQGHSFQAMLSSLKSFYI